MKLNKRQSKRVAEILVDLNDMLQQAKAKYERVLSNPVLKRMYETPDAWMKNRTGDNYVAINALRADIEKYETYIAQLSQKDIAPAVLKMWDIKIILK